MVKIENNLFIVVFLELIFSLEILDKYRKNIHPTKKNRNSLQLDYFKDSYTPFIKRFYKPQKKYNILHTYPKFLRQANLFPTSLPIAIPIPPSLTAQCILLFKLLKIGFFFLPTPNIPDHLCPISKS